MGRFGNGDEARGQQTLTGGRGDVTTSDEGENGSKERTELSVLKDPD